MLIYILFCSIFKRSPSSFPAKGVGPETSRWARAEGAEVLTCSEPKLQVQPWGMCWLSLSLGALPGVWGWGWFCFWLFGR